jgi:hypothetical protein
MTIRTINRRSVCKLVAFAPLLPTLVTAEIALTEVLSPLREDEANARAFGYRTDGRRVNRNEYPEYDETQRCATCIQLREGSDELRGCKLFAGRAVHLNGWCKVWAAKE